jgi:hypothetical protein
VGVCGAWRKGGSSEAFAEPVGLLSQGGVSDSAPASSEREGVTGMTP